MTTQTTLDELSPARRREIFSELVSCQDAGMSPEQSRERLAPYFSISVETIKEVEEMRKERKG